MTSARWGAVVGLAVGLIVLGPALGPGYVLHYDMVFGPALTFDAQTMGWDGAFPRAVPNDAVVAALSVVLPGWVVQKILLLAVFVAAGSGTAALVSRVAPSTGGAIVAAVVATWNPWVAERMAIGHWGFLLGYAALGWVAALAYDHRHGRRSGRWLPVALVAAALTGSTGVVLAWGVVVCIVRLKSVLPYSLLVGLLAAPWWYPALFLVDSVPADPAGVRAFAATDDTGWGAVTSLVSGGGVWNEAVHFAERNQLVLGGAVALVSLGIVVAAGALVPGWRRLLLAGGGGLMLAALPTVPGGRELVEWIVQSVPGGGLLRDSQKFAGAWMLVIATAAGLVASRAAQTATFPRSARRWLAVTLAVWPVALLPSLAWGHFGAWQPVDYPESVTQAAEWVDDLPAGDVAVFPWSAFRRFVWNGDRVLLDPWMRLVDRPVLTSDDLIVDGETIGGENPRSRAIADLLDDPVGLGSELRAQGLRWVIEWTDQPVDPSTAWPDDVPGAEIRHEEGSVRVWDLGPVAAWQNHRTTWPAGGWILFAVGVAATGFLVHARRKI